MQGVSDPSPVDRWPKRCFSCNREWNKREWPSLRLVGYLADEVEKIEMRQCPYLVAGLRAAGFRGGWLNRAVPRLLP